MKDIDAKPSAIDLFSGAGGLTLGLKQAGFDVVAGVELDEEVCRTYKVNHPEVRVLAADVTKVSGDRLRGLTGRQAFDLVAGCPPCQGFTSLTEKYKRDDPRNVLVLEMARLVEELKPRTVMMENVPGLAKRGAPLLDEFVDRLQKSGYLVKWDVLQLADYGIPQSRRRLVLLAGLGFEVEMPKQTHSRLGGNGTKPWRTLRHALKRELGRPKKFSAAKSAGGPRKYNWHIVSDLDEISLERYRALKAGQTRAGLPKHLRPDCHKDSDKGFHNVYGRMRWDQTPVTITGGCTTPCKGRFGHPTQLRTISVREAALIQTFPLQYRFETNYKEFVCEMIGNALPPKFAKVAANQCYSALSRSL